MVSSESARNTVVGIWPTSKHCITCIVWYVRWKVLCVIVEIDIAQNILRKTMHWNYDYYVAQGTGTFENSKRIVHLHATHCLDILRQKLMCIPDVGVLGQLWWQSDDGPKTAVDFFTEHKCRDFEGVRRWAEAHQLPADNGVDRKNFLVQPKPEDVLPDLP